MVAVINWFDRRRSLAISLVSSGMAVGGVFVYLVIVSIEELGLARNGVRVGDHHPGGRPAPGVDPPAPARGLWLGDGR
ncbi:MAG: hypothetical protein U5Q44_01285 [Dehalococcoidia bacterium]|nr:hypothetical protein [Dehalococcoidia bacterium]